MGALQKSSGCDTVNPWEIYFYLLMYSWFFVVILLVSIMSIFTSVFQRVYACFYYSIYFFGDSESSFVSWTTINSWFLKFSLRKTNWKCKAFHFTSLWKFWVWLFYKNMKDTFNERLPYITHFVFLYPFLRRPQILLTFIRHLTWINLSKKN